MPLQTQCPNPRCNKTFQVSEATVGKKARCHQCDTRFIIRAGQGELVSLAGVDAPIASVSERKSAASTSPKQREKSAGTHPSSPVSVLHGTFSSEESVPADWRIGEVLLDLYEVTGVLGEGGFGKVYKIHHKTWNLDLAVKSPRIQLLEKAGAVENFEREADTWVNLGLHPQIASCHYVRRLSGIPRVFAEYLEGGDLASWIRDGRLYAGGHEEALKRILDIAIQFAWGLHYAHEKGLIHQDVKPANVLMKPDGTAKVSDSGLAKARAIAGESASTTHGQSILVSTGGMTPAYCSPEQASGQPLSRKTDLWSWALSVLEMFTGKVTWRSGTLAQDALEEYLEDGYENANAPQMPTKVAELLQACFHKDPQVRPTNLFQVAGEIIDIYVSVTSQPYPRQEFRAINVLADSLNNRALSFIDLQKPTEAEGAWRQALTADPHHLASVYNLGLIEWRSGRIDDLTVARRVHAARSTEEPRRAGMLEAQVEMETGDYEMAVKRLETLEAKNCNEIQTVLAYAKQRLPATRKLLRTFEEHTNEVHSVCLSLDGRYALSGGGNSFGVKSGSKTLKLWEVATGKCLRTFEGHALPVTSVGLSVDGRYALSGSDDMTLKLWDVATGKCLRTFEGHALPVKSVCLSIDGRYALSGSSDKTAKLWEVATGKCLRTFEGHTNWMNSVCLSVEGRYALSGSWDKTLKLWEVSTGQCLRTFEEHIAAVNSVCLSVDGLYALSGSSDKTAKLWEVATGKCLRTFEGHTNWMNSVCLSVEGRYALSGSDDKTLKLWEVATGKCLRTFEGHTAVKSVCLSGDGRYALSGSWDNTLKLWDVTTGKCLRTFEGHTSFVNSVCLSVDGRYALSGSSDNSMKLWSVNLDAVTYHASWEYSYITHGGDMLAVQSCLNAATEAVKHGEFVQAVVTLRHVRSLPGWERFGDLFANWQALYRILPTRNLAAGWHLRSFPFQTNNVTSVCLSADGRYALSGADKSLKLWEVSTGKCLRTFEGHISKVTSAFLSVHDCYALSGSEDTTLKIWEVATGECLRTFEGHTGPVKAVCLSVDDRYVLSGSMDSTLKLWDVNTGKCLRTFGGHGFCVTSVCLSVDGRYAVSGSWDKSPKLWEVATSKCIRAFEGHIYSATSVCLSMDGRYALSGSDDKTLKLWDVTTGKCLRTFEGHAFPVTSVCLSVNGCYALSGSSDKTLKLWNVATGKCLQTFEEHTGIVRSVCLSADGRYALSGGDSAITAMSVFANTSTLKLWTLDWELVDKQRADWDDGARRYLHVFLVQQTPYAGQLPRNRQPNEQELSLALTRRGRPTWTDADFQRLLQTLAHAGFGWLRPEGVKRKLQEMAATWTGPPPLFSAGGAL